MYSLLFIISRCFSIPGATSRHRPSANVPHKCVGCGREPCVPDVFSTEQKSRILSCPSSANGSLTKQTKMTLAFQDIISSSNHTAVASALWFKLNFFWCLWPYVFSIYFFYPFEVFNESLDNVSHLLIWAAGPVIAVHNTGVTQNGQILCS